MNRRIATGWIILGLTCCAAAANELPADGGARSSTRFSIAPQNPVSTPARFALQSASANPKSSPQRFHLLGSNAAKGTEACDGGLLFGSSFEN
jgi:hypothetical protein